MTITTSKRATGDRRSKLWWQKVNCRSTVLNITVVIPFITLALDHLSVKDIAYLVGNSPDIIYKHYASRSRNLEIPEF